MHPDAAEDWDQPSVGGNQQEARAWRFCPWTALLSAPLVLLSWRGALRSCFWRSTISFSPTQLIVDAGWLNMRHTELPTATVLQVDRRTSMSSNGNAWYNLTLITRDGARIQIARGLPDRASARLTEMLAAVLPKHSEA